MLEKELGIHDNNLYGKSSFHDSILFEGSVIDLSKVRSKLVNLDKRNYPFVGRKKDLYKCVSKLVANNDINIYGTPGIGKTAIAKEIAYFLHMRNFFREGIFYFDLTTVSTVEKLNNLFRDFKLFNSIEEVILRIN